MAINLDNLKQYVVEWRPDLDAQNQMVLLDALRQSARMIAVGTNALREVITVTQPQGSPIFLPLQNDDLGRECLKVLSIRMVDANDATKASWLRSVSSDMIRHIQDPSLIPAGTPRSFCSGDGFAYLDAAPEEDLTLAALVSYTLPADHDIWPFPASVEQAIVSGALWLLLERPGRMQNLGMAQQKRAMFNAAVKNIVSRAAIGLVPGDARFLVQMANATTALGGGTQP